VIVAGVALWARLSRSAEVFVDGETIPVEHDCYYHLRRILLTAADFPNVPIREPHINWPIGADCGWPPGFDQPPRVPARAVARGEEVSLQCGAPLPRAAGAFVLDVGAAVGSGAS
jgi:asparagine N-glycosylation enzyme membrane subunit Stt3